MKPNDLRRAASVLLKMRRSYKEVQCLGPEWVERYLALSIAAAVLLTKAKEMEK